MKRIKAKAFTGMKAIKAKAKRINIGYSGYTGLKAKQPALGSWDSRAAHNET